MDREKQEKEVMEYLGSCGLFNSYDEEFFGQDIVQAIMRRYDLFDTEDLKRGK